MSTGLFTRIVSWLSAWVTGAIIIAVPVSYFFLAERYIQGSIATEANMTSHEIMAQIINRNPDWWDYEQHRLDIFLSRGVPGDKTARRQILNLEGEVIAENGVVVDPPVLSYSTDLLDAGLLVGRFEIQRSLRPLLGESLLIALFMVGIGILLLLLLRLHPLRRLQRAEQEINRLAATDPLTGLSNRHAISRELNQELGRAIRYGSTLSLIMIDVDHFKSINDRFGHDVGDRVLVAVSDLIQLNIRSSDKAARWGGEEFLILAPETDAQGALEMAEKLCREVATRDFEYAERVTISAGLSQFRGGDDPDTLLKRADETLYQAKRTGRNRVISQLS